MESRKSDRSGAAQQPRLQEAVELYRDHFLAGFNLKDAPGFDEWVFFQSENMQRDLAYALETLVRCQLEAGAAETAIPFARRWVSLDTLNEAAQRQLMRVYEQAGQHSAALRQYQECARLLREEIGAQPDPETIALYERIKSGEERAGQIRGAKPHAEARRPHLPVVTTPFIGRVDEQAQIGTLLANPDCRLLTLVGPGGVGKTRVALQAAGVQLPVFSDGAFFVALAPISEPGPLVSAIADAVGFSFFNQTAVDTQAVQTRQLLNFLSEKHSCWCWITSAAAAATSLLSDMLAAAPATNCW
jgi:tetratricopeptide (TPR) repeat protein